MFTAYNVEYATTMFMCSFPMTVRYVSTPSSTFATDEPMAAEILEDDGDQTERDQQVGMVKNEGAEIHRAAHSKNTPDGNRAARTGQRFCCDKVATEIFPGRHAQRTASFFKLCRWAMEYIRQPPMIPNGII